MPLYIPLKDALTGATRALESKLSSLSPDDPPTMQYDSSFLTLTSVGTPDPFVTRFGGRYYFTFTAGDRVEIWWSHSLADIENSASRHVIWNPPQGTDHSAELWAPELHPLHGRWYVYYAAANPALGNKSHRVYVLGGPPSSDDPCEGKWEFLGRIQGMPPNQWAIDGTVFELGDGELYFAYSGWPLEDCGGIDGGGIQSDLIQQVFIMRLENPTTAASGAVAISRPQHAWEVTRDGDSTSHGINEGPQFLQAPDGRWRGLVYSCAGSWTHEYKMATLQLVDGSDPLDPTSWKKGKQPLVQTRKRHYIDEEDGDKDGEADGLFGPGHGSFVDVNGEVVAIYHATDNSTDGWQNRRARAQRVMFTKDGPYMGAGESFGTPPQSPLEHRPEGGGGLVHKLKQKLSYRGLKKQRDPSAGERSLRALLSDGRTP
ncbi:hypothetical protein AAE478_009365 [Parahypoxylon ruwenzoriense]